MELIGEAASHIPDAFTKVIRNSMEALRQDSHNRLIHSDLDIDNDTLRSIIRSAVHV